MINHYKNLFTGDRPELLKRNDDGSDNFLTQKYLIIKVSKAL